MSVKVYIQHREFLDHPDISEDLNPYQVINELFDYYDLVDYRENITMMLKTAYQNGYWNKSSPADLLYVCARLARLIDAPRQKLKVRKL